METFTAQISNIPTIHELDIKKAYLLEKIINLTGLKNHLFAFVDIESPMSETEKLMNRQIAEIYSEINSLIGKKKKTKNN